MKRQTPISITAGKQRLSLTKAVSRKSEADHRNFATVEKQYDRASDEDHERQYEQKVAIIFRHSPIQTGVVRCICLMN